MTIIGLPGVVAKWLQSGCRVVAEWLQSGELEDELEGELEGELEDEMPFGIFPSFHAFGIFIQDGPISTRLGFLSKMAPRLIFLVK